MNKLIYSEIGIVVTIAEMHGFMHIAPSLMPDILVPPSKVVEYLREKARKLMSQIDDYEKLIESEK